MKLLTAPILAKLRKHPLGSTSDQPVRDVLVKFFTPDAGHTFYVTEGEHDPVTGDWKFFGYVTMAGGSDEWGYFMFSELRAIRGKWNLPIERDRNFEGTLTVAGELH